MGDADAFRVVNVEVAGFVGKEADRGDERLNHLDLFLLESTEERRPPSPCALFDDLFQGVAVALFVASAVRQTAA